MRKFLVGVLFLVLFLAACGREADLDNADVLDIENGYLTNENEVFENDTTALALTAAELLVPPSLGINELSFANPFGLPLSPHGGNILHAWNMSFNEIINHLPYIAEAGFNVIQTSPIGASLVRQPNMGTFGRWYDLYQPTHFTIGNYLGTEEEFRNLTRAAAEFGIFIIIDAIPNHTTAYWNEIDPNMTGFYPSLFHSRFGENMLTNVWASPMDFGNRRSFVRSNLLGLWDFYTSRPEFQLAYIAFLNNIIEAGASGFRFDAAHHIELPNDPPDIASDFWPNISGFVDARVRELGRIPFQYGEVLGGGYRANHYLHGLFEHANFLVTPYAFSRHILSSVENGFLNNGQSGWNSTNFFIHGNPHSHGETSFGPAFTAVDLGGHMGFAEGVVPWVESHDQYGNDGLSRGLSNSQIIVGWALIAARQGTSPLFFVRPGEGFVNSGTMFQPQDDGSFVNTWGHQLLYRDRAVAAINWFANDFKELPERTSTFGDVAIIERGAVGVKTGAVLVNVGTSTPEVMFPVHMVDGIYICDISGNSFSVYGGWLTGPNLARVSVSVLRLTAMHDENSTPFMNIYPRVINNEFFGERGLNLTFVAKHFEYTYALFERNGELISTEAFWHGETLLIGAEHQGFSVGDVLTVTLVGTFDGVEHRFTQTYTKIETPEAVGIRVEYVRDENNWNEAGIWAWNSQGDVFAGGWPGSAMTWAERLDGEGYAWVFYLPENTVLPVTLIFNNFGAGEQTVPYLTITEPTRVFQIGEGVEIGNEEPIFRR